MAESSNVYGFTIKTDSGKLVSWTVVAPNRKQAFNQLTTGNSPDCLLILTGRLTEEQANSWHRAATEHGGFDDQMARAILAEPLIY